MADTTGQTQLAEPGTPRLSGIVTDRLPVTTGHLSATINTNVDRPDTHPVKPIKVSDTPMAEEQRVSDAVEIVRERGALSGRDMSIQMGRRGHPMSERTGLRWRVRAEAALQRQQILATAS
jgi:hypothetical protein